MLLVEVRERLEALLEERARRLYEARAGLSPALDLGSLYARARDLLDDETFTQVREAAAGAEGRRKQRLEALSEGLFTLRVEAHAAGALYDRQALEVQSITGLEPGERLSWRAASARLASETGRDKREALERRLSDSMAALPGVLGRTLEAGHAVAQRSGFASLEAARTQLSGIDEAALAAEAEAFLSATDGMYADVLGWWLKRTSNQRPFPHGAERHDVLHAAAALPFDGLFPRGDLKRPLAGRLLPMGLDPFAKGRIRIDSEVRPMKSDAAFAAPLHVPGEVVVVYRPQGGLHDSRGYLHALGRAQLLANVEAERPFEDRWLGDESVTCAMGFLFDHWLVDKRWLERALQAKAPDLVRVLALSELVRARSEAAAWLAERTLARDGVSAGSVERVAEAMTRALLGRVPAALALSEIDGQGTLARTLRGRALQAALLPHLLERFDEDWWQNPRTGSFLSGLFAQGQFEPAHQIAERLALGPLSLAAVARQFEALFA